MILIQQILIWWNEIKYSKFDEISKCYLIIFIIFNFYKTFLSLINFIIEEKLNIFLTSLGELNLYVWEMYIVG